MTYLKRMLAFSLTGIIIAAGTLTFADEGVVAATAVRENVESTASDDTVIVGVSGTDCTSAQKDLLDLVNKIRYEACTAGNVPDPRNTNRMLTSADYKPIKLGVNCTKAAQIRSAEAGVTLGHVRPNDTSCFNVINSYISGSIAENLAWSNGLTTDISGWTNEKSAYIKGDFSSNTGHYKNLINPDYLYTGMATFNPTNDSLVYGSYKPNWSCTAGQYSSNDVELTSYAAAKKETVIQKIQIPVSRVSSVEISGDAMMSKNGSGTFTLYSVISISGLASGTISDCPVYDGVTWSSSNSAVVDVNSKGVYTAKALGNAVITATIGSGSSAKSISREIVVADAGTMITAIKKPATITVESGNAPILSKTVEATLSNGKTIKVNVDWKSYNSSELLTHFASKEFDITGSAAGHTVTQTIHVNAAKITKIYTEPSTITTTAGTVPELPSKVKINLSNNYTWTYNVSWDQVYKEYCSNIYGGTYTVTGKVTPAVTTDSGTEYLTVSATLIVEPMAIGKTSVNIKDDVTSINDNTFKNNKTIKSIVIGKNVKTIGSSAFAGCKNLKKVTMGGSVNKIGNNAFANCTSLKSITIPAKVTKLGNNVFTGCTKLKTITIKSKKLTNKTISKKAFKGINKKTVIKVPKKLKKKYTKLFRKKGLSKKVKVKGI